MLHLFVHYGIYVFLHVSQLATSKISDN